MKTGTGTLKKAIEPHPDVVVWRWQAIHSAVLRPPKN